MSDSYTMHSEALSEAIDHGPREFNIRGEVRMAYGLKRAELKALFQKHRYNITSGIRWRSTIVEWCDKDLYCDRLTMDNSVVLDKKDSISDWAIIFAGITREDLSYLRVKAEDKVIRPWPSDEVWNYATNGAY